MIDNLQCVTFFLRHVAEVVGVVVVLLIFDCVMYCVRRLARQVLGSLLAAVILAKYYKAEIPSILLICECECIVSVSVAILVHYICYAFIALHYLDIVLHFKKCILCIVCTVSRSVEVS